jgi:hypothetical protein
MSVLMPMRFPAVSTSAPARVAGLIAASVWMKLPNGFAVPISRPTAETIPMVTVWPDAERVADREDHVPHARLFDWPKVTAVRLGAEIAHHREVGLRVGPDHLAHQGSPVAQGHLDVGHALHHVVIGEDVALAADDHPGAERQLGLGRELEALAEEALEGRVVEERGAAMHLPRGRDVDDRGDGLLSGLAEGQRTVPADRQGDRRAGAASRTSTTCWARQASQSGFTRLTTNSPASVRVTAWAKTSQSLRMDP